MVVPGYSKQQEAETVPEDTDMDLSEPAELPECHQGSMRRNSFCGG